MEPMSHQDCTQHTIMHLVETLIHPVETPVHLTETAIDSTLDTLLHLVEAIPKVAAHLLKPHLEVTIHLDEAIVDALEVSDHLVVLVAGNGLLAQPLVYQRDQFVYPLIPQCLPQTGNSLSCHGALLLPDGQ